MRGLYVHGSGFAGVLATTGVADSLLVENSTFETNGFAHVLIAHAKNVEIRNNSLGDASIPIVLSGVNESEILQNGIVGSGWAAIAYTLTDAPVGTARGEPPTSLSGEARVAYAADASAPAPTVSAS